MNCYIVKEEMFMQTSWAKTQLHAIKSEATASKIKLIEIRNFNITVDNEIVIILATNINWIKEVSHKLRLNGFRIITIGPRRAIDLRYNEVLCNFQEIASKTIDYCVFNNKKRILLFGINPPSSGDNQLKFYLSNYYPDLKTTYETLLKQDIKELEERIDEFDVILCCNSIIASAVVEQLGPSMIPSKVWVISLLDSPLSKFSNPTITGFAQDDEEIGRQAIHLARLLKKNEYISNIVLKTSPKLNIRESTDCIAFGLSSAGSTSKLNIDTPQNTSEFYNDDIVENLFNLENVLSNLENPDYTIIEGMLAGETYAQISEEAFMSENTVKYRIKRMQKLCNVEKRSQLLDLIVKYCPKFVEEHSKITVE
jgi:hypothetical protein